MKLVFHLWLILMLLVGSLPAQWSTDPSVNTRVTDGGLLPQIISDGSGGTFIVYQDTPALLRQLWVQWLDRFGYVRFPDNGIRISSADRYQTPYYYLVSDSAGGVIVLFEERHLVGDPFDEVTYNAIYAQHMDSSGTKLWGDAGVELSPFIEGERKGAISACSDGANGAFVFWGEDGESNGAFELRAQRITANGQFAWPDTGLVVTDKFIFDNISNPNPAVSDGARNAIILYSDSSGTKLQKVNADGAFMWGDGMSLFPLGRQMIADNFGGAIVAGVRREFDGISVKFIVGANRLGASGQVLWGHKGTTIEDSLAQSTQTRVYLAKHQQGGIVIGLRIFDFDTGTRKRISRRISNEGVLVWANDTLGGQVVTDDFGNSIFLSFEHVSDSELNFFVQRVDDNGVELWDMPVLFSKTGGSNMVTDTHGGVIAYWSEIGANSRFGIFAQQISRNGNLGEVLVTSVSAPGKTHIHTQFLLHQSYPNPFNAETLIKYEIPESYFVTLIIYDIAGKEVLKLVDEKQPPGTYQVTWNGKNKKGGEVASGIYFYQLRAGSFVESKKAVFIK
ncbi:MAG: T9SS type A sorting domain-containing protein [bacterium]